MLMPRKTKFRKAHRGRRRGEAKGQSTVQFGDYGIKALEDGWITNRQIEAARIAMTRKIKRGGKVWINVFPDKSVTKKPAENVEQPTSEQQVDAPETQTTETQAPETQSPETQSTDGES